MRARALVIGINRYSGFADQKDLKGAVADAIDFARWALDSDGGQVAADDLYFWAFPAEPMPDGLEFLGEAGRPWPEVQVTPDFSRAPSARDIAHAAAAAADAAAEGAEADEHERLYVFLAGHGATLPLRNYANDPQNCFLAGDYVLNDPTGLVPLDQLRRMLEHRGPQETILIHDCCRNRLSLTVPEPVLSTGNFNSNQLNKFWLVGRAARIGELAFEVPHNAPTRGAFTKLLVQGLKQFRVDDQLTLGQLRTFVQKGVALQVAPAAQVPMLVPKEGEEDFVLLKGPPAGEPPEIHISPPAGGGTIRVLDGREGLVEDIGFENPIAIDGTGPVVIRLQPGSYIFEHEPSGGEASLFHYGPEPTHVAF